MLDQGWYLQVSARIARGETLYSDVLWMYPPLPVFLLAGLFRALGINALLLGTLQQGLAILGCLLTYRIARFLLSAPLALLCTLALQLGGWWGGFTSYVFAYTGAVPLGAVLGLGCVVSLLMHARGGRPSWSFLAGIAAGAAFLAKPEHALACAGTGVLFLVLPLLFPSSRGTSRRAAALGLATFAGTALLAAGLVYGPLVRRAGWAPVWAGISGYDQDTILLGAWPPWGNVRSWLYMGAGLALYTLLAAVLLTLLSATRHVPGLVRIAPWVALILVATLAGIGWVARHGRWPAVLDLLQRCMQLTWAPGMPLVVVGMVALATRWHGAVRRGRTIGSKEWGCGILTVYSGLANLRSFLHPLGTLHFQYLSTLAPLLVYAATCLLPRAVARWKGGEAQYGRARTFVAALLAFQGILGIAWTIPYLARFDALMHTPRGEVHYPAQSERRRPWAEMVDYLVAHTNPGDEIVILGHEPGLYFWSDTTNPLRQDTILPGMSASPEDAQEMLARIRARVPRLVIIPRSVPAGRGWFWDLPVGRRAYDDLQPLWHHVGEAYRLRDLVGGELWGYDVYEPRAAPRVGRRQQRMWSHAYAGPLEGRMHRAS